jgi:hypothetical protein
MRCIGCCGGRGAFSHPPDTQEQIERPTSRQSSGAQAEHDRLVRRLVHEARELSSDGSVAVS